MYPVWFSRLEKLATVTTGLNAVRFNSTANGAISKSSFEKRNHIAISNARTPEIAKHQSFYRISSFKTNPSHPRKRSGAPILLSTKRDYISSTLIQRRTRCIHTEASIGKLENDTLEDNDNDENADEPETDYKILCLPFFEFIRSNVSKFSQASPTDPSDYPAFKAYWRDAFSQIRNTHSLSGESSLFLTDPPLQALDIEILNNASEHRCPCCLETDATHIRLRSKGGITRDDFLQAISEQLYGENVQAVDVRVSEKHAGMVVLKSWDYMMQGGEGEEGQKYFYGMEDVMKIWMYCSDRLVSEGS